MEVLLHKMFRGLNKNWDQFVKNGLFVFFFGFELLWGQFQQEIPIVHSKPPTGYQAKSLLSF